MTTRAHHSVVEKAEALADWLDSNWSDELVRGEALFDDLLSQLPGFWTRVCKRAGVSYPSPSCKRLVVWTTRPVPTSKQRIYGVEELGNIQVVEDVRNFTTRRRVR